MHKGKKLWNPVAQQEHSVFVSLQILCLLFWFLQILQKTRALCQQRQSPTLTNCLTKYCPLTDLEATYGQVSGSNYLAGLEDRVRGTLLPEAAAQGYSKVGGQEIGTGATAPQDVLPHTTALGSL